MAREGFLVYHDLLSWLEPYGEAERGRLLTAMLIYSMTGEETDLSGNERFLWPAVKDKIDRDKKAYDKKCKQMIANGSKRKQLLPKATKSRPTETETETATETITDKSSADADTSSGPAGHLPLKGKASSTKSKAAARHKYGEYGWVLLTDGQYQKLLGDLGEEELKRCIRIVDEAAQKTGNRCGWKDWNLTLRNCHRDGWGLKAGREAAYGSDRLSGSSPKQEDWNIIYD